MPLPIVATLTESVRGLRAHGGLALTLATPLALAVLADMALALAQDHGPGATALPEGGQPLGPPRILLAVIQAWLSLALTANLVRLTLTGPTGLRSPLSAALRFGRPELRVALASVASALAVVLGGGLAGGATLAAAAVVAGDAEAGTPLATLAAALVGVLVMLRLALAVPATVAGDPTATALRLSWRRTRGQVWRLVGLLGLTTLVGIGVSILLSLVGGLGAGALGVIIALAAGLESAAALGIAALGAGVGAAAGQLVASMLAVVVLTRAYRALAPASPAPPSVPDPGTPGPLGGGAGGVPRRPFDGRSAPKEG